MSGEAIIGLVVTVVIGVAGIVITVFFSSKKKTTKIVNKNNLNFNKNKDNEIKIENVNFGQKK